MKLKELRQAFSQMTPDEKQKQAILESLLELEIEMERQTVPHAHPIGSSHTAPTENSQCKTRPHRKGGARKRLLSAAVLTAILFTTTVFAAHLGFDTILENYLGSRTEEQISAITAGAQIIDQRVSRRNGTVHIKQVVGDNCWLYIFMEFIAPKGVTLNAQRYWFDPVKTDVSISGYSDYYGVGFDVVDRPAAKETEQASSNSQSVDIVMKVHVTAPVNGQKIKLTLGDLQQAGPLPSTDEQDDPDAWERATYEDFLSGTWKFSFQLDYQDCSQFYSLSEPVDMYGHEAVIQSVTVSPFTVSMSLESSQLRQISQDAQEQRSGTDDYSYPIIVHFNDGTTSRDLPVYEKEGHNLPYSVTHHSSFGTGKMELTCDFTAAVFDKEITAIEFFDQMINLK